MSDQFSKDYWEGQWHQAHDAGGGSMATNPPNPYLSRELGGLPTGTVLDVGCGAGAEAIWLASAGWQVTGVDISPRALAYATERAATAGVSDRIQWVEADATVWKPDAQFDLVLTCYAHPSIPQLDFYDHIGDWVKPGGTLGIIGHLHTPSHGSHSDGHHAPAEASATAATISARLKAVNWRIVTAEEHTRFLTGQDGREISIHDVVVRASKLS